MKTVKPKPFKVEIVDEEGNVLCSIDFTLIQKINNKPISDLLGIEVDEKLIVKKGSLKIDDFTC